MLEDSINFDDFNDNLTQIRTLKTRSSQVKQKFSSKISPALSFVTHVFKNKHETGGEEIQELIEECVKDGNSNERWILLIVAENSDRILHNLKRLVMQCTNYHKSMPTSTCSLRHLHLYSYRIEC